MFSFPQSFCSPAGTECSTNLATNDSCLPTCTGLYADITEDEIKTQDGRKHIELLQKEYYDYKDSFGAFVPFIYDQGI